MEITERCYIDNTNEIYPKKKPHFNKNLVFVFDTETTTDRYQDLLFGSCAAYSNGHLEYVALFHGDNLGKEQLDTLQKAAFSMDMTLLTRDGFVKAFMDYVYKRRAVCTGFNLPFDISRIAKGFNTSKIDKGAFSFKMADDKSYPRIFIKHLNSKHSFIRFIPPRAKNRKNKNRYRGVFVDLKTLTFALTNKSHSLESACILFNTKHQKLKVEVHGTITREYVRYNVADVEASHSLYKAMLNRIETHDIPLEVNELSSPAAIGPAYFRAMSIKPFLEQNPNFPKEYLGYALTTYFGGRTETRIRKKLVPVTYCDATSMYPSVFCGMNLWELNIANKLVVEDDPDFKELLAKVQLEDLNNKAIWPKLRGMALVRLTGDIFPIRGKYGNKIVTSIGVNYAKGMELWFSYPDIVASKLLTNGKIPELVKMCKFKAVGVQSGLRPIKLFGEKVDPKSDLIKYLIEHRLRIKERLLKDPTNESLRTEDHLAKVIANSCSYGKFVQIDTKPKRLKVDVYGLEHFQTVVEKEEVPGDLFNPMIGTLSTAGARLRLAMAEAFVKKKGGYYSYMDTDSIWLGGPEGLVNDLKAFFKPLNPYNQDIEMFKVEKGDDNTPLDKVLAFCISSKRYCMPKIDGNNIEILKASNHGLGFMLEMSKENVIEFWKDIIRFHNGTLSRKDIEDKYANKFVSQQLSITSPQVLRRFKNITANGKRTLRPFSFMIVGQAHKPDPITGEKIIPVVPFTKDSNTIPYQTFFDLRTGKVYSKDTESYWKPLSKVFFDFYNHKEEKFNGDIGELARKHVDISGINYIGKEANNIEETSVFGVSDSDIVMYDNKQEERIRDVVKNLTEEKANAYGIKRRNYFDLKRAVRLGKKLDPKRKIRKKLLNIAESDTK